MADGGGGQAACLECLLAQCLCFLSVPVCSWPQARLVQTRHRASRSNCPERNNPSEIVTSVQKGWEKYNEWHRLSRRLDRDCFGNPVASRFALRIGK